MKRCRLLATIMALALCAGMSLAPMPAHAVVVTPGASGSAVGCGLRTGR